MRKIILTIIFFSFFISCNNKINKDSCIWGNGKQMSLDRKKQLNITSKKSYNHSVIHKNKKTRVYQYWENASHSSIDNFYLSTDTSSQILSINLDEIKTTLLTKGIKMEEVKVIMLKIEKIIYCDSKKLKNKF